jgi:hypothetical protein
MTTINAVEAREMRTGERTRQGARVKWGMVVQYKTPFGVLCNQLLCNEASPQTAE